MSKYNILRDEESQSEKKDPVEKEHKADSALPIEESMFEAPTVPSASDTKQTPDDNYFSDELFPVSPDQSPEHIFEERPEQDDHFASATDLDTQDFSVGPPSGDDVPLIYDETAESEYPLTEKKAATQPLFEYEADDKQEGLNYKPIMIGAAIVIAIVAVFFIVSNLFMGESEEEAPQQTVESAEDKLKNEQEDRKQNFLREINRNTTQNLKSIYQLTRLDQPDVKYSSILLYGNTLNFEIFVPDRGALAKYNLKIKSDKNIEQYNIEAVDQRRGSKGGLFALYGINIKNMAVSPSSVSTNPVNITPDTWESRVVSKAAMTVNSQRSISTRQENLFRVSRIEYDIRGSLDNSLNLINQLATSNMNLAVHKLTLLPTDQRNMSASSYMLKLIIDFYL